MTIAKLNPKHGLGKLLGSARSPKSYPSSNLVVPARRYPLGSKPYAHSSVLQRRDSFSWLLHDRFLGSSGIEIFIFAGVCSSGSFVDDAPNGGLKLCNKKHELMSTTRARDKLIVSQVSIQTPSWSRRFSCPLRDAPRALDSIAWSP